MLSMISSALDDVIKTSAVGGLNVGLNGGLNVGINVSNANSSVEQQGHLLSIVRGNPSITQAQLAQIMGVSKRQVERIVAELKVQGRLVRKGAKRNCSWEVR